MNLLKIGDHVINLDQMTHIELQGGSGSGWSGQVKAVGIHFSDGNELVLNADDAARFRDWFKRQMSDKDDCRIA